MGKRVSRHPSDATRQRLSESHRQARNGMWKKHHSETTKRRISEALKRYWSKIPKT